ncbi:ATP-binding protein [Kitasatospora sp. NPDC057542]|uniref:ATP-binding protein n=1 Tax=Streptomycetaceae TaxID=2062 RepID=UPI001CD005F7|nr:ATP-binding protein [Streptomyces sp. LS1784]
MSSHSSTTWLPRSRRAPSEGRALLASLLASTPNPGLYLDSGLLIVSELVTNALLHGTPAGHLIYLALDLDPARLRIEVHDARRDREPVLRALTLDGEAGRGLHLVKSLSIRTGCSPRKHTGKIVWCEVAA